MSDRDNDVDREARERRAPGLARRLPFVGAAPRERFSAYLDKARTDLGLVFEREMEAGRGFLWLPVLFGIGILGYFALPREPSAIALVAVAVGLVAASWASRRRVAAFRVIFAFAAIAAGAAAMKLRTDWVTAPVVGREMTTTVTGWVSAREATPRGGARLYIRVAAIERVPRAATPETIRVTVRSRAGQIAVGDAVSVLAQIQPPSGPVLPGGYDFARAAFYQQIGAIGFAYGAAKPADLGPAPLDIRLMQPLADLREMIRRRIVEGLPGDEGQIAAALIMGDQGGVSDKTQDDMRASGLGHVLSISGLHMALVAGSAFWLIRALLALSTGLALRRPIKKWAAAGAVGVAAFYVGLSGGGVATDRSFIMLAIMLTAVMLDRRAITLRNVALAAIAILVVYPESLLSVSFQMSFAATIALVAGYEAIAERSNRQLALADGGSHGIAAHLRRAAAGLFLTSLLAGLATTPFGAFHFQRVAPLTMLANLAAMPVVGMIVMPMAVATAILMPFGLEVLPLTVMGYGLDWMMAVAARTSAWSEGLGGVPMAPAAALLLAVAGFLWLALWHERWRVAGLVPIALALPLAFSAPRPDVIVSAGGTAAAIRGEDGRYRVIGGKGAAFEVENWLRADADPRKPDDPSLAEGVLCDPLGCTARLAGGAEVAVVFKGEALAEDCRLAAIVITRLATPAGCSREAAVIDKRALAAGGSHALYRRRDGPPAGAKPKFTAETAYPAIRRPFMPPGALSLPAGQ